MIVNMDDPPLDEMLDLAKRLATEAAAISVPLMGHTDVTLKPDASVVTEVDHAIQERIFQAIHEAYPDHAALGEETVPDPDILPPPAQARFCWVVDPLDGTRNYAARVPIFATSIAVLDRGRPCLGVINEHNLGHTYCAIRGRGATLNGRTIHVEEPVINRDCLVGIPSSKDSVTVDVVRAWAGAKGLVCRNVGATALHVAMVASGSFAAAFAKQCKIWDIAAGWLLVNEAGGRITDLGGDDHVPFALDAEPNKNIPFLAGAPEIHQRLLEMLGEGAVTFGPGRPDRR